MYNYYFFFQTLSQISYRNSLSNILTHALHMFFVSPFRVIDSTFSPESPS